MRTVSPLELANWSGRFIDVRNLDEYAAERVPGAECVPLDQVGAAASAWDKAAPVLVMCKSGMRSGQAAARLEALGFTQVAMLGGGIDACKKAGVQVVKEKAPLPLFRQILIGAGLFLLAGLALSLVHPAFILIDWFVAVMLVIAGVTGFCPMAKILSRMPWNATPASCTTGNCSPAAAGK